MIFWNACVYCSFKQTVLCDRGNKHIHSVCNKRRLVNVVLGAIERKVGIWDVKFCWQRARQEMEIGRTSSRLTANKTRRIIQFEYTTHLRTRMHIAY